MATKSPSPEAAEKYVDWEHTETAALKEPVHSLPSLEASRAAAASLLLQLDAEKRQEYLVKCLDVELKLQESIRAQTYSSGEQEGFLRRWVTFALMGISTVLFLLIILLAFGGAAFGWNVDVKLFETVAELMKYSFLASLSAIVLSLFPAGRRPK